MATQREYLRVKSDGKIGVYLRVKKGEGGGKPRPKGAENFWDPTEENIVPPYDEGGVPDPLEHAHRNMHIYDNGDPL